jgi:hypothetical protein
VLRQMRNALLLALIIILSQNGSPPFKY